ncbi:hypothetical protein MG290_10080 [Flavobacterium sp. CBA20B-1]|uniref:hypothetical protein n=1 Tax=unclassified Flavobacterium TaxID=196869 RepID=UPI00222582F9|nr:MULTISPECIES: hypothetical protein [unclassified Flavobacterium]WCM41304.1 hypothetical protein MG290_10080 [Flavobacterium sp. CBA20B-1]
MEINSNASKVITLEEAIAFTHAYQTLYPNEIKAYFAGSNKIESILSQENCIGIRIYNGYNTAKNTTNLVLVGVNALGEDMTNGIILENLVSCPQHCSSTSVLLKP